jgi:hypothetical protein
VRFLDQGYARIIHFYDNLHPVRKELKRTLMFNRIEEKIIDKEYQYLYRPDLISGSWFPAEPPSEVC